MKKKSKDSIYKIMSSIRSEGTTPEIELGKSLWRLGLRYRKHYKLMGKPDFVFVSAKVAVFCDGDFWHGNKWKIRGMENIEEELSDYSDYWRAKILRNIARDKKVNSYLKKTGWTVVRFWESDIKKASDKCAKKVHKIVKQRRVASLGLANNQ